MDSVKNEMFTNELRQELIIKAIENKQLGEYGVWTHKHNGRRLLKNTE